MNIDQIDHRAGPASPDERAVGRRSIERRG
jgi:hypothetical protein